jgi:TolB-like protein/Tfp pilus assembly protein PilF
VRLPGWAFGSLISLAVLALVWWVASHRDTPNRTAIDSIAVLPFVNASGDPEEEYFVDGMTEALIADLAKIRALKVISRTSAMQFKGAKKPLPEIARALNVEAVVEGSVLRAGGRVRITAELIHAPTDEHLWAESYDRELRDVLRLQSEVAQAIAEQIKVTLTPQEQARMAEARPVNPAAHEAYLKGRFYWNKRTPHDLQKAVEYFERAIDLDPAWPLAYAGLADAYALLPYYAVSKPSEAIPKARAAASTALQLDDSLGEAHASVGQIATYYDWDWPLAEREFQRALSLSPNYATAHHWYAAHLRTMGRDDEAIKQVNKAQELDPLSLSITSAVGWMHYFAGDFAEAEVWLRKALELGPDFATAHGMLARTLFFQRKFVEATAEAREAVRLSHNDPVELTIIGYLSAQAGQTEEARRILDELTARSKEAYVPPTRLALVHAGLEERDRMFECLETANRERDVWLPITLTDPLLAEYRSDPRFVDLVRSMGLPMPKAIPSATAQPTPLPGASSRPPPLPSGDKGGLTDSKIMLVVLPFDNLSGDPEQEYFNDSMTEELISQLGHINPDRLEVIARTSAMPYKKRGKSVEQIGRELNVDYVVEGSVRRADDRIRINAQLVHVGRQTRVWGESFNRELRDILVLQSDVAVAIARQINVKLNPQEESRLAATRAVNPAAYEAYMRGRFQWHNRTRDGMHNAIEHFEHAIDLDPEYAGAYAGLADVHSHLGRHGFVSPKDAFLSAQQAALKAVELDPGSAEAHGALAVIALYFEWDWAVAERGLLRALQLNPSFEEGHHQYSHLLHTLGKPEGSLTESRRALELNPLDPLLNMHLGWHYMMARQYNEAVAQLRSVLDVDPEHYHTLRHIGWAYLYSSRHAEAIAAFEAARKVEPDEPDNPQVTAALAAAHAAGGRGADARALLKQLEDSSRHRYVSACDIAAVYAALRELDTSLEWLEKALDERSPRMMELGLDPVFDPLRTDPRFVDLLRRVGLPQPP